MEFIESETVELKRQFSKEFLKEVVAFGNTTGGTIYIGINDDGTVEGVAKPNQLLETISNVIIDGIKPAIIHYISLSSFIRDEKDIIRIEVQRGDGKPYYLASKGMKPSGVYLRLGNTSVPASDRTIREMIIDNHGLTYETRRSLSQELTFHYAKDQFETRQIPFEEQHYKSLGMKDHDGLYNNIALLLSDQCPHFVKAAIFHDSDKLVFRHRQEFKGSLLKQLDDVYQFLETQNHVDTVYNGLRRMDRYDYDLIALREALINAIVHRDYSLGGQIIINIDPVSIEMISLGSLPNGICMEEILEGVSKSRNEKLSQVFYRLELIEAYGTGIRKILHAYRDAPLKPSFKVMPNAFKIILPITKTHEVEAIKEVKGSYDFRQNKSPLNLLDNTEVIKAILQQLSLSNHMTRKELEDTYGFGQTKSGQILKNMEKQGQIIKMGKGKNTYYMLK